MRHIWLRCCDRYQAWRTRAKMELLREKFAWLEAACFHAGEDELSSMLGMIWSARQRGEQHKAMLALMFRNHNHYGPLQPVPVRKEGARVDG